MHPVVDEWDVPGQGHIEIWYDDNASPDDARAQSNVGTMLCSHPRYRLGDEQADGVEFTRECTVCAGEGGGETDCCPFCEGAGRVRIDAVEFLTSVRGARVVLPLWLYDHSGLSISCGERTGSFADRWDSGQLGYIFDTPAAVAECIGATATDEQIRAALEGEVAEYNDYLTGQVFGYTVTTLAGEEESCGGFVGDVEYVKDEAAQELAGLARAVPTAAPRRLVPALEMD